ncbi:uncharacterized protein LOC125451179 isoform X1 [Stegostoma tigrinum]|uniref:uncharacterized protein LOC125451179 isoform X1 n=1 Tax=Stegostoma tigrinum TaxID=3053191 RepID=UPI00202ACB67|nr:uncharacterized protein LOC125451179 isoform X1 [Stegostoma tigrinum]
MSRSVSNRKKKVTFREHPTHCEKTGRRGNNPHSNAIRSYFPFLIKQLKLSSPLYQSLNKKGVLTTDQIGLIELEDLAELKVAKLLEIVRNADGHVFKLFCSALGEMGYWYLAQILQTAAEEKDGSTSTGLGSQGSSKKTNMEMKDWNTVKLSNSISEPGDTFRSEKQDLKEILLLSPVTHRNLKNNNLELSQKMEHMRKEYLRRIHELEEELASVSRERDITMRERNIIVLENHELQNLNHELQKLILKLESSTLSMIPNYPIHCVNVLPVGQMTGGQTSLLFTFNQHR